MSSTPPVQPAEVPSGAVFLSYASQDAEAGKRICEALRAAGVEVWFDQSELRGGDAWDANIRRQIKDCALFVPIISVNTQSRPEGYFRLEWRLADQRTHLMGRAKAFVLPVCVDTTRDTDADVPDSFLAVQWTRLPGGATSPAFVERVQKLLGLPHQPPMEAGRPRPAQGDDGAASPAAGPPRRVVPVWLWGTLAAVVVIGVAAFWVTRRSEPAAPPKLAAESKPAPAVSAKSIAVLPFTNMSENKEASAFFADGMHEDVITNLALIRELRVVSRTTAMQYRDTKKPLREIGEELGVAYVLEGSVQRLGQKVRVTGQLIDARTDQHVWAKSYDRDLTDIFAIQSELAQAIAAALQAAISPQVKALIERRPTENLAAYDLFLKARDVRNREGPFKVSLQKQETLLQSAVTLDPDFAAAWAELVYACGLQYLNYYDHSDAMRTKATVARDNAVRLAPEAPEIIRGQGDYCFFVQHDYPRAIEHYEKFVRLQPNEPNGYRAIGSVQRWVGRWAEAVANYRKGTQLDPQNINIPLNLALLLGSGRRYDEALSEMRRVVALHPDAIFERYELALIPFEACGSTREMHDFFAGLPETLLNSVRLVGLRTDWAQMCGDFPEASRLDRLQPYDSDDPRDRAWEALEAAMTLAAQGDMTAARARLENNPEKIRAGLELDPTDFGMWGVLGQMEALLGHSEEAVRCARKAVELMPESLNAWAGPGCSEALANVYAWIGDKDRAFAEYSRLLRAAPGGTINHLNVHELKHGPWGFPLRDDPRFQALLDDPKSNAPLF